MDYQSDFAAKSFRRVPVKGIDGYFLRSMNYGDYREYVERSKKTPEKGGALMLVGCLVNDKDERVYSFDDVPKLDDVDPLVLIDMCKQVREFMDVGAEKVEGLKKRSRKNRSSASCSSSADISGKPSNN